MIPNERNDYVETIAPILYCFKIYGIIPMQLKIKHNNSKFLASKSIAALTQFIYLLNAAYNVVTLFEMVGNVGENFNLKMLLAFAPQISLKFIVSIIPLGIWTKTSPLSDYWNKWKEFQTDFERISETEFDTKLKKTIRKIIIAATLFILMGEIIVQNYIPYDDNYVRFVSDYMNISIVYYLGAYWYINCIYTKSIAKEIISLAQKILTQNEHAGKLHEITSLWITSCELMEQFYVIHSTLLLVYIIDTIVAMTIFAFICMNSSAFIDIYGVGIQLNGLFVCMFIIFLICETAYSVFKQVVINQRKILLSENLTRMNSSMLQSILIFLEAIFVKNPGVSIKGYLTLNRSVFVSILAVCINYLIVLRQFQ
ncbi:gustatory and odorant receptor 24-like [Planococcus citri]|uniref:gustatory and odorant receptor 24-like n=1 Tax=Planococcus citri TaxID=170843 RepID=UPI0031F77A89